MSQPTPPDIETHLTSEMEAVRAVVEQVQADLARRQTPRALCDDTQIVLSEVLNNVVEHAYVMEGGHPIDVSIWMKETGLTFVVRDHGIPMPGGTVPAGQMPEIDPSNPVSLPEGGFGWALVHRVTSRLNYERVENTNRLTFSIEHPNANGATTPD